MINVREAENRRKRRKKQHQNEISAHSKYELQAYCIKFGVLPYSELSLIVSTSD